MGLFRPNLQAKGPILGLGGLFLALQPAETSPPSFAPPRACAAGKLFCVPPRRNPLPKKIQVVAVDDHPLMRNAIRRLLAACADLELVAQGCHGSHLDALLEAHRPAVLLLDRGLPRADGAPFEPVAAVTRLKRAYPHLKIIILTEFADLPQARKLILQAKVEGYLLKSADPHTLLHAIRQVAAGQVYYARAIRAQLTVAPPLALTQPEQTILRLAAEGLSNRGIGQRIGLSENRVRKRFTEIYQKLGVTLTPAGREGLINRRMLAVKIAREKGLL